ncbi:MAG TPA: ATP-binding protein, partial [Acidimicrobiales bacterium]
ALVLDLHPSALADKGLDAALEELCAAYQARAGVGVTASIEPVGLDAPGQHAVLRITQEALANATKHADPRHISVRLGATASGVELVVSDDGRGFDPASPSRSAGIGLRLMRERVAELGGTLEVESTPDRGTAVRVHLPVLPPIAATPVGVGPPATHPAR